MLESMIAMLSCCHKIVTAASVVCHSVRCRLVRGHTPTAGAGCSWWRAGQDSLVAAEPQPPASSEESVCGARALGSCHTCRPCRMILGIESTKLGKGAYKCLLLVYRTFQWVGYKRTS